MLDLMRDKFEESYPYAGLSANKNGIYNDPAMQEKWMTYLAGWEHCANWLKATLGVGYVPDASVTEMLKGFKS